MKDKYNIAMIGGRGFVGSEVIKILNVHPLFFLTKIFSTSAEGEFVTEYTKSQNLKYSLLDKSNLELIDVDIVIMALANNESFDFIKEIDSMHPNTIIIDISSDYRFDKSWHYRIPEITKDKITNRISNPGCYASAIQFSIEPIKELIDGRVSCMGISGYSGAGASPSAKNDPENLLDNIIPYSLSGHIHEKEVIKNCYENLTFSPHVGNFFRGILITSHMQLKDRHTSKEVMSYFEDFYKNSSLIKIGEEIPMINKVAGTHLVHIGGFSIGEDGKSLTICCVLDNLLKGAATQIIQNLNCVCGIDELTGINYE